MNATAKEWTDRLKTYSIAEPDTRPSVTVSKAVFERAKNHDVWINPRASGSEQSRARVRSSSSDATYDVVLIKDDFFPTFPYVWKCNCKWGRERFEPCSHVIAVALERGRKYENEYANVDRAREEGSQTHIEIGPGDSHHYSAGDLG